MLHSSFLCCYEIISEGWSILCTDMGTLVCRLFSETHFFICLVTCLHYMVMWGMHFLFFFCWDNCGSDSDSFTCARMNICCCFPSSNKAWRKIAYLPLGWLLFEIKKKHSFTSRYMCRVEGGCLTEGVCLLSTEKFRRA